MHACIHTHVHTYIHTYILSDCAPEIAAHRRRDHCPALYCCPAVAVCFSRGRYRAGRAGKYDEVSHGWRDRQKAKGRRMRERRLRERASAVQLPLAQRQRTQNPRGAGEWGMVGGHWQACTRYIGTYIHRHIYAYTYIICLHNFFPSFSFSLSHTRIHTHPRTTHTLTHRTRTQSWSRIS